MELNEHNKKEYPPMHTAEHILNQTMVRMFGCERSKNTHIERKKSKADYMLSSQPSTEMITEVEKQVNLIIGQNLEVNEQFCTIDRVPKEIDLSKLPDNVSDTLRLISVGDYDICACIGLHVKNTSEIGVFKIISHDFDNDRLRIRFKLLNNN